MALGRDSFSRLYFWLVFLHKQIMRKGFSCESFIWERIPRKTNKKEGSRYREGQEASKGRRGQQNRAPQGRPPPGICGHLGVQDKGQRSQSTELTFYSADLIIRGRL